MTLFALKRRSAALALALAVTLCVTAKAGEPRVPQQDGEVLQQLPAGAASRTLAPLRARFESSPADSATVLALAQGYLDIGRAQADPRHVSYALTTLSPLIAGDRINVPALILAATAQQYLHRFDAAQQTLDRVLLADPRNAQANLIRADLQEVAGDLPAARASCTRLLGHADSLVALTCLSSISSRSGELDVSFQRLQTVYDATPALPAELDIWILSVLAEMAQRRRDDASRANYLQRALRRSPRNPKLKAQYADLLLERGQYAAVRRLLANNEAQDALLLRLAIAALREHGATDPQAVRWVAAFDARLRMAGADAGHKREQARFLLELRGDPAAAVRAAQLNWQRQREPEDLRLLVAAARAARQPEAVAEAYSWMGANRFEDRNLP